MVIGERTVILGTGTGYGNEVTLFNSVTMSARFANHKLISPTKYKFASQASEYRRKSFTWLRVELVSADTRRGTVVTSGIIRPGCFSSGLCWRLDRTTMVLRIVHLQRS